MVMRNIVKIDEEKCTGCGQCVTACAEGAIKIINGKAKLVSETYCDGLGACLGHCPEDAISVEQREAAEFDEETTKAYLESEEKAQAASGFVCPGLMAQDLSDRKEVTAGNDVEVPSQLSHWPVQLKLVSPGASYLNGSDLLLVADCVPFAMGDFHNRFLKDHSVVVGCPKLDDGQYYIGKLAEIIKMNKLNSLTVVHMEVLCCSGLIRIAQEAIMKSGVAMTFDDVTISLRGYVLAENLIGI